MVTLVHLVVSVKWSGERGVEKKGREGVHKGCEGESESHSNDINFFFVLFFSRPYLVHNHVREFHEKRVRHELSQKHAARHEEQPRLRTTLRLQTNRVPRLVAHRRPPLVGDPLGEANGRESPRLRANDLSIRIGVENELGDLKE